MKTFKPRFRQFQNFGLTTAKNIGQHIEWSGVTILFGFATLGTALSRDYPIWFVLAIAAIGIALVLIAAHNSYRNKSAALVDKYEERSFERMESKRKSAAKFLLGEQSNSDELEDVLDYLESPISDKVISGAVDGSHIYSVFYHWIRLYCQAAKKFIENYQEDEPAAWTGLRTLYERTSVFEKRKLEEKLKRPATDQDLILEPVKLRKYLLQEAGGHGHCSCDRGHLLR